MSEPLGRVCEHGQLTRSCDYCSNAREIADLTTRIATLTAERDAAVKALHNISLASQNSGTTKEDLGREARAATRLLD